MSPDVRIKKRETLKKRMNHRRDYSATSKPMTVSMSSSSQFNSWKDKIIYQVIYYQLMSLADRPNEEKFDRSCSTVWLLTAALKKEITRIKSINNQLLSLADHVAVTTVHRQHPGPPASSRQRSRQWFWKKQEHLCHILFLV